MDLETLGFSKGEIEKRVIETAVDRLLQSRGWDEDGDETVYSSELARKLEDVIRKRIDDQVVALADKYIAPRIGETIEGLVLQETNRWGEKKGQAVTFIEYLVQRAEAYMTEQVDYNGKPKGTDSFSWTARSTRVSHMIHQHLHYQIEAAMKQAFAQLNSAVAKGLHETVRLQINEVLAKLKVEVKA
jgi:hypothetical protein